MLKRFWAALTGPIKIIVGTVAGVLTLVAVFYAYRGYDAWKERKRQEKLAAAHVQVGKATVLRAEADTMQAQIRPAKQDFKLLGTTSAVRNNPVASSVHAKATTIIKADSATIGKQKEALAHQDTAIKNLVDAGPPLGPRAIPYLDGGYLLSNKHRGVPYVAVGVDYRLLPHGFGKFEVAYEPPPSGWLGQDGKVDSKPEFKVKLGAHITLR